MKVEEKEGGEISLRIETLDDLWYLSNIVSPGDIVFGFVFRKDTQASDMKRAKKVERKKIRVGIEVKKIEFQEFSDRLRIQGIIVRGPEDYLGSHQSINVAPGDEISILKDWSHEEKRLMEEAIESSMRPQVYFLGLEHGLATLAVLRSYGVEEILSLRKRGDEDEEFFGEILHALREIREEGHPLVILGPGFYKENFVEFAGEKLGNYILVQASHGDMRGVYEVLKSGVLDKLLKEHRVAREEKLVELLLQEIKKEGLYAYGREEVEKYLNLGAVDKLLVSDRDFRKYRELLELASKTGAEVHIVSSSHEAGKILQSLGGIAALLRFRLD